MIKRWSVRRRGVGTQKIAVALFFLVILILGIVRIHQGWSDQAKLREIRTWPQAQGVIVQSAVKEGVGKVLNNGSKQETKQYSAEVHYTFEIDKHSADGAGTDVRTSTTYSGNRVTWRAGMTSGDPSAASAIVKRYPPGQPVSVFYNPADPNESVLSKKGDLNPNFIVGGIFLLVGAVGALVALFTNIRLA